MATKPAATAPAEASAPTSVGDIIDIQSLLESALEKGAPPESIRHLILFAGDLKADKARLAFLRALTDFQGRVGTIGKTETAGAGGRRQYRYATLDHIVEQIRAPLVDCGLSYSFTSSYDGAGRNLAITCCVHHLDGYVTCSDFTIPVASDTFMNDAQHMGSASSYGRRYALCNALGLVTGDEDDDAQTFNRPAPQQASHPPNNAMRRGAEVSAAIDVVQEILTVAETLGYNAEKVRKWVNQKYAVTTGLAGLKMGEKEEVLKIFREQAAKKLATSEVGGTSASNPKEVATAESPAASPTPTETGTANPADERVSLEPAADAKLALTATMVKVIQDEMAKAGLDPADFDARFGFSLPSTKKSDYKTVMAWVKDPHEK